MGMTSETQNRKVVVINTGGTISMTFNRETDAVLVGNEQPLHQLEPMLHAHGVDTMVDLFQVPSPHMTPAMMRQLSDLCQRELARNDVAGVVVTHGTDTLEETAYFLDLTVSSDKPVVVTGAMRSSNEVGADGPVNLLASVRVASDPRSVGRGTLVVFNDEIHAARFVTKTHTSNVSTFQSPSYGPIGFATARHVTYHQPAARGRVYAIDDVAELANIPVVKMVAGQDARWLAWLLEDAVDGLIVEALGAGNVPPPVIPILQTLCDRNVPVVIVSRCYNGYVEDVYGYEGGGHHLRQLGCIFSNGLNGQKARIKLMVLCGAGVTKDAMQLHFEF